MEGLNRTPVAARDARDAPPFARRIARRVAADSLGGMAGKGAEWPEKGGILRKALR